MAENSYFDRLHRALQLQYDTEVKVWLTSGYTLRQVIGVLGMLLPILLVAVEYGYTSRVEPLDSLSHYYYTRVSYIFVIVISLMAVFLILYQGKAAIDFYLSTLAGVAALGVIIFPTYPIPKPEDMWLGITEIPHNAVRETVHLGMASTFLLILACLSIFRFTRPDRAVYNRPARKRIRNRIYLICGILMIASVVAVGLLDYLFPEFYSAHRLTFWLEVLAVEAFGVSWLVKGNAVLRD